MWLKFLKNQWFIFIFLLRNSGESPEFRRNSPVFRRKLPEFRRKLPEFRQKLPEFRRKCPKIRQKKKFAWIQEKTFSPEFALIFLFSPEIAWKKTVVSGDFLLHSGIFAWIQDVSPEISRIQEKVSWILLNSGDFRRKKSEGLEFHPIPPEQIMDSKIILTPIHNEHIQHMKHSSPSDKSTKVIQPQVPKEIKQP